MHIYKSPAFIKGFLPGLIWKIPNTSKEVYLTFDDGPVAGVTEWVLDVLGNHKAKASFFVVGENVVQHPDIYKRILKEGHTIGNHTHNHLNAWQSGKKAFLDNVHKCDVAMDGYNGRSLFRPPHGKLTPGLIKTLKKKYSIVMWDVLSGDYNSSIPADKCLEMTLKCTSNGSIIVFHDSYKAENNLKSVLPTFMSELSLQGFSFKPL